MKYFQITVLLLLLPVLSLAQEQRLVIPGQVYVPEGFDPDGINIYNKTANLGSITVGEGRFELRMKEGDTIYFSGVQFESQAVVVDKETITLRRMEVEIREGLNELPEVVIRPHDLTGNLSEDIKGIEVVHIEIPPMVPSPGPPTGATTTANAVVNEIGGGANHLALIVKGIKALFPKREKTAAPHLLDRFEKGEVEQEIRNSFDAGFFNNTLGIPTQATGDFLAYSITADFDTSLLKENRRLELMQYLVEKSKRFKQLNEL